jgi:hypothetical protein
MAVLLQDFFDECIVGHGLWHPRSDSTTLLSMRLSQRVYSNNPQSLEELKLNFE